MSVRAIIIGCLVAVAAVAGLWRAAPERLETIAAMLNDALAIGGERLKPVTAPASGAQPVVAVTVSQPLRRATIEWDEFTGRLEAAESVEVRARASGYLNEIAFADGQHVKAGDLLFVIDPRPYERALDQARAEAEQTKVKVYNTRLDVTRGKPLAERNVISQKTQDDRESLLREAEAAVKVAEAKVKSAELDLSFTRITAPISGRIGQRLVTSGNFIAAGGTTSTTVLTTIVSQDPIHVYFDVPEANAVRYRRAAVAKGTADGSLSGSNVEVGFDGKEFPLQAKLDFQDNRIDTATATLRARAVIANPAGLLTPGMFARVRLQGAPEYQALLLPDEAIGTDQASRFVTVVADDGSSQRRPVTLGPLVEGLRVVREGVGPQEWVVVKGMVRVRPGVKLAPTREPITLTQAAHAPESKPIVRAP